ncbi:SRPBCC family protein [Streptomyces sp. NPDC050388]|uniref:SRPBCC family protein n=1 Tax=Streptomyces sp. NPDC050388 TaxID=3155781 RepID=UPI00342C18C1
MHTVEETIEVAVPVRTAYDAWTQFKSFPRFMTGVRRVDQIRPTVTRWVVGVGPVRREVEIEIVEQVPDSHLVWRSLERRPSHRGEVSFRSSMTGTTEITVRVRTEAHGATGVLAAVPGVTRRVVRSGLQHFKTYIEGMGDASGAWRGTIRNGHVQPMEPKPSRSQVPCWPVG